MELMFIPARLLEEVHSTVLYARLVPTQKCMLDTEHAIVCKVSIDWTDLDLACHVTRLPLDLNAKTNTRLSNQDTGGRGPPPTLAMLNNISSILQLSCRSQMTPTIQRRWVSGGICPSSIVVRYRAAAKAELQMRQCARMVTLDPFALYVTLSTLPGLTHASDVLLSGGVSYNCFS